MLPLEVKLPGSVDMMNAVNLRRTWKCKEKKGGIEDASCGLTAVVLIIRAKRQRRVSRVKPRACRLAEKDASLLFSRSFSLFPKEIGSPGARKRFSRYSRLLFGVLLPFLTGVHGIPRIGGSSKRKKESSERASRWQGDLAMRRVSWPRRHCSNALTSRFILLSRRDHLVQSAFSITVSNDRGPRPFSHHPHDCPRRRRRCLPPSSVKQPAVTRAAVTSPPSPFGCIAM